MDIDWRLELLADASEGTDVMRCVDLYNEAMSRALGSAHWDLNDEQWQETLDGASASALWVCRSELGQVEGFALSCMYAKGPKNPLLQMLSVSDAFEGRGLGKTLLKASLESMSNWAEAPPKAYVRDVAKGTQAFYRKNGGWIDYSRPDLDYYGQKVYPVEFSKKAEAKLRGLKR